MSQMKLVAAHKVPREKEKQWYEYMDEAVARQFPVMCVTSPTRGGLSTYAAMRDGSRMPPSLEKKVSAFIKGWRACEESYK